MYVFASGKTAKVHSSLFLTVLLTSMSSPRSGPQSGSCTISSLPCSGCFVPESTRCKDGWSECFVLGKTAWFHTSLILLVLLTLLTSPRSGPQSGIILDNSSSFFLLLLLLQRISSRIARPCLNLLLQRISRRQKLNVFAPRNVFLSSPSEPLLPLKKES
jgi:hypothetical protein